MSKTIVTYADGPRRLAVGDVALVHAPDPYGFARLARRTVNADGSPRADLLTMRVVRIERSRDATTETAGDGYVQHDFAVLR